VFGILKLKALVIGMFLASPALAMWVYRSQPAENAQSANLASLSEFAPMAEESTIRIPVEVIVSGNAPELVYVQVANQAVPEPGTMSLFALLTLLLVIRRHRC
jgi:hypothetical protein